MLLIRIISLAAFCLCQFSAALVFPNWVNRGETIYYRSNSSSSIIKIGNRRNESFRISGMDGWFGWRVFDDAAEGVQDIEENDILFNANIVIFDKNSSVEKMLFSEKKLGDLEKFISSLKKISGGNFEFESDAIKGVFEQWNNKGFGLDPVFLSNKLLSALKNKRYEYKLEDAEASRVCGSSIYSVNPDRAIYGALIWFSRIIIASESLSIYVDPSDGMHPPGMQGIGGALPIVPYKLGAPTYNNFYAMSKTGLYQPNGVRNTELTGKGVDIYVIDTASNLKDQFVRTNVKYYDPTGISQVIGHGAVVGQIIKSKTWGVAPNANIIYRNACDQKGRCSTLKVIDGICSSMAAGKASIINLSLGTPIPLTMLRASLEDAARLKILMSASYGNRSALNGNARGCEKIRYNENCSHFPADWSQNSYKDINKPISGLYSVAGWDIL